MLWINGGLFLFWGGNRTSGRPKSRRTGGERDKRVLRANPRGPSRAITRQILTAYGAGTDAGVGTFSPLSMYRLKRLDDYKSISQLKGLLFKELSRLDKYRGRSRGSLTVVQIDVNHCGTVYTA